jgi:hypothetical protein
MNPFSTSCGTPARERIGLAMNRADMPDIAGAIGSVRLMKKLI